jgi:tRNA 2-thiouridine synthesizing protein A
MADKTLDTRGLTCPLPILKAKKAIGSVPVGGTLEVLATDPGSREDFVVFACTTGHDLIEDGEDGGVFRFVLRRAR